MRQRYSRSPESVDAHQRTPRNSADPGAHVVVFGASSWPRQFEFVEDGSFVKLREATLSYDFKELLFGKSSNSFVKTFTLGAFVRNVIIWTPYKGVDPETNLLLGANATSGGIDYFNNPGTKVIGFNLKAKF